jgi:Ca2+-binding EF-hand superfamily protein
MDDFWKMYDSFKLMDKRGCGSVRRCDFYEASTEHLTVEMQRTIQRADLHRRFRSNAADLPLQELLDRIWPNATDSDQKKMTNWTKLRDASTILLDPGFQGTREDLKRIFDLLDADGSNTLSMGELVRARIITKNESHTLLEKWFKAFSGVDARQETRGKSSKESVGLNFNEFCRMTQKHLCEKYVKKDTTWEDQCRSAYKASRASTAMMIASREGRELSLEKETSPQKKGLKAVGLAVVAPSMFARTGGNIQENARIVMAC